MRGGGCKDVNPGESPYITHNWCAKCEDWRIGKPFRCPECNYRTRASKRYKK